MTDETKPTDTTSGSSQPAAAAQGGDEPDVVIGLVTDGAHSLIIARFPTMADAEAAYADLVDLEQRTSLRIDGVMLASCDAAGKIHLGKVTDHSTKTGLKWGVVGGVLLGIVFPPSIIAGAVGAGTLGAVAGKVRNVFHRRGISDELAAVMKPNTAGIMAIVEDTAVVEIQKALAKADQIVSKAIDDQVAAEIDREAAAAKESLGNA
jgi:uncharacterized membrane protein